MNNGETLEKKHELMPLDRPIVIIGAARSGTTLLAKILARHSDLTYVEEPNVIWRYSNAHLKTDSFDVERATPHVASFINRYFETHLQKANGKRLLEKTPANALRVEFVHRILPTARFVHVVRDGRDVAVSALRKWEQESDSNAQLPGEAKRFRYLRKQINKFSQIPLRDMVYYLDDIAAAMLFRFRLRERKWWGPRPANWRQLLECESRLEICARQWIACIDAAKRDFSVLPESAYTEIRYEDLKDDPTGSLQSIYEFCELEVPVNFKHLSDIVDSSRRPNQTEFLSDDDRSMLMLVMGERLSELGYQ